MHAFLWTFVVVIALNTICVCMALLQRGELPQGSQGARLVNVIFELVLAAWAACLLFGS
jgi:hypothetical protein